MSQHRYPGINVDLKHPKPLWRPDIDTFSFYDIYDYDDILLPLREVFMMTLMDRLTDKAGWHKKVFDQDIVAKWRQEASEQSEKELFDEIVSKSRVAFPGGTEEENNAFEDIDEYGWDYRRVPSVPFPRSRFISKDAFEYCMKELRTKAAHFEATGYVPTLDSLGRAVVKSDTIVDDTLKSELRAVFHQLSTDQAAARGIDWHPGTNGMVQDLVHPSLYPFVYGRSPFSQDEVVGVENAVKLWAGKGATAPDNPTLASNVDENPLWSTTLGDGIDWSAKYQWLPSNLKFQDDGSVRFTSYINNLHPTKYTHVYRALEKLIDLAIPAWDQVLLADGMKDSRFSVPEFVDDDETEGLWEPFDAELVAQSNLKPNLRELERLARRNDWVDDWRGDMKDTLLKLADQHQDEIAQWKWDLIRDAILPEPDNDAAINYQCKTSIRETYKNSGLQIIIKMARIELTPEKPDYSGGGWHVEGMINERICATALYYLDSENITPSYLAFRTQTDRDQERLSYGQNAYNWLERLYGVDFNNDTCLQYYGRVETREGRMLTFPNCFQHRVTPFSLKDRTKPGHRSFIALWLVDPTQRIVSTANVPPQQLDWWSEAVMGVSNNDPHTPQEPREIIQRILQEKGTGLKSPKDATSPAASAPPLPQELIDLVAKDHDVALGNLMSHDEALAHRLQLMAERTALETRTNESAGAETYNFCEH